MTAESRRAAIVTDLQNHDTALSASALAETYHVSRQIIVGDIALLRAAGHQILATPKGYVLERAARAAQASRIIACQHTPEETLLELYTVVDHGGSLKDVIVEHPIYGELRAPLHVACRADADAFMEQVHASGSHLLSRLTDGIHLHTLCAPDEETIARVMAALGAQGFLLKEE